MNILIADDEILVRSSLRSMLEELDLPIRIAGEARNGEELLALLDSESPDLVFVDIRMPKLSGLDAIRLGKEKAPGAHWIILTGFTEFEYAQEAIRLGATNYLLKPADPAELASCVQHTLREVQRQAHSLNCEFEHWISLQIRELHTRLAGGSQNPFPEYSFAAMEVVADSRRAADDTQSRLQKVVGKLLDVTVPAEFRTQVRFCSSGDDPHRMSCYWAWPAIEGIARSGTRFPWRESAEHVLRGSEDDGFSVTALLTDSCGDIRTLLRQAEELHSLAPLRIFRPEDTVLTPSILRAEASIAGRLERSKAWMLLTDSCSRRDFIEYAKRLGELRKQESRDWHPDSPSCRALTRFVRTTVGARVQESMQVDEWFHALSAVGDKMLASEAGGSASQESIVQRVIRYVDLHYMEEIGIGKLAEEFGLTPNYLSSVFHKKQGVTFVKYLTSTRMLKAKQLLLTQPSLKVNQVAEAVGYFSTRHFTKLFVEHFGVYPSDFRDKAAQSS
ncbi:response regulator [Cohnella pontilimi]|uniref:Response regulator n=1 Tax=Cohnella pontilimi TaxID=2564100 RepID=A0A4U0F844_9BACL|nr:response regulator [Cohnella pontilimi]TJY40670.1 response regulator [Cohnella pontilimi]